MKNNNLKKNITRDRLYKKTLNFIYNSKKRAGYEGTDITTKFLIGLVKRIKHCTICNCKLSIDGNTKNGVQFDHVIPLNKGGKNNKENIRVICQTCNKKRPHDGTDEKELQIEINSENLNKPEEIRTNKVLLNYEKEFELSKTQQVILNIVLEYPEMKQKEIAKKLKITAQHLSELVNKPNFIKAWNETQQKAIDIIIKNKSKAVLKIIKHINSKDDRVSLKASELIAGDLLDPKKIVLELKDKALAKKEIEELFE